MCEKSRVVEVVSLAVLASFIGSSLARSDETNATNATLAKPVSAIQVSSHAQVTPSVLAATAMTATAIGLAAALRRQASLDNRNRIRNPRRIRTRRVNRGSGWAKAILPLHPIHPIHPIYPIQPTRPSITDEEDYKMRVLHDLVPYLYRHIRKSMTKETLKSLEEKILNGVDVDEWREIGQIVREEIRSEDVLKIWEQVDEIIQEKMENGKDIYWEEMMDYSDMRRNTKCTIL